jgi:hypothetical protein
MGMDPNPSVAWLPARSIALSIASVVTGMILLGLWVRLGAADV